MRRAERLVCLAASLLGATRPVPFAEIRTWFPDDYGRSSPEAAARQFERDCRALVALGFPVRVQRDEAREGASYFIDQAKLPLRDLDLTRDELAAVYLAASALLAQEAFPYREALERALEKITLRSERAEAGGAREALRHIIAHHPAVGPSRTVKEHLDVIERALSERRRIRLTYRARSSGARTERVVAPYGLTCRQGRWLLVAQDEGRAAIRVFAVPRVERIGFENPGRGPEFEVPPDFELRRWVDVKAWNFSRHEPITAVLESDPEFSWLVARTLRQAPEGDAPGSSAWPTFSVAVTNADGLLDWLQSLGPKVRIIAPPDLRARMIDRLEALIDRNRTPVTERSLQRRAGEAESGSARPGEGAAPAGQSRLDELGTEEAT